MIELGTISKLLTEREEAYKAASMSICDQISGKLTGAFRTHLKAPNKNMKWTAIELIEGTNKAVLVSGLVLLEVGDDITMDGKEIKITEENVTHYNRLVKFAFPITMLEVGTEEELVSHIEKMTKISSSLDITPEDYTRILDKLADAYHNDFVNDPQKLSRLEEMTKPPIKEVLGFDTSNLTAEQVSMLEYYAKNGVEGLN